MMLRRYHRKRAKAEKNKMVKSLENMTVEELQEMAKARGIKGYSRMKKKDLIVTLQ